MPIFTCKYRDELELYLTGITENLPVDVSSDIFAYLSEEGPTGFDDNPEGIRAWECLTKEFWFFERRTGELRLLPAETENRRLLINMEVSRRAITIAFPNDSLISDFEKVTSCVRKRKLDALRKRYNKPVHAQELPLLAEVLLDGSPWKLKQLNHILTNSSGMVIWKWGHGEYGITCLVLSSSTENLQAVLKKRLATSGHTIKPVNSVAFFPMWCAGVYYSILRPGSYWPTDSGSANETGRNQRIQDATKGREDTDGSAGSDANDAATDQ